MLLTSSCLYSLFLVVISITVLHSLSLPPPFVTPEALDELRSTEKMEEFIKHLGIPDATLCHPDTDENMEPMFNADLDFGDLIIDKESEETDDETEDEKEVETEEVTNDIEDDFGASSSAKKSKKSKNKPRKWVNGTVPYYISNDFNAKQKQRIEDAIEEMNTKISGIYLRPYRNSDRNYVIIFSGKGCYAKLGMTGGQQPVSLQANKCLKKGTIQHEMLHVLGFSHEQNRSDRDEYIDILYENIPEKWHKNYKRYNPSSAVYIGEYDYYSVMHYPPQAPGSHGKRFAFRVLDNNIDLKWVGNRKQLSKMDIQKARDLYSNEF